MVHPVLEKAGNTVFLSGNEAIVRGAIEAGVDVATTYPGTPASEIGDTFNKVKEQAGMYFEYSVNEKVAAEVAIGAALSNKRAITSFKHLGFNVALDPIMSLSHMAIDGGLLIVSADDPGCWTSKNEQDSRSLALFTKLPFLDPSSAEEAREMARIAFDISEKFKIPIVIRTTARISHEKSQVTLGNIRKDRNKGEFIKNPDVKARVSGITYRLLSKFTERLEKIHKDIVKTEFGKFNSLESSGDFGIITNGVSYNYVKESLNDLKIKAHVLKIGSMPIDHNLLNKFVKNKKKILVVEELDPVLESEIYRTRCDAEVFGKNVFLSSGELSVRLVSETLGKLFGKKTNYPKVKESDLLIRRIPAFCPGCPHKLTYQALEKVFGKDTVYSGDIGCYNLGVYLGMMDTCICMGASISAAISISKSINKKVVALIGDSTFFHSGTTGLIDAVINNANITITIFDNRITAMTGHQPSPDIDIEKLVKGCGVEKVFTVDPFDFKKTLDVMEEAKNHQGVSVVIAKHPCALLKKNGN